MIGTRCYSKIFVVGLLALAGVQPGFIPRVETKPLQSECGAGESFG